MAAAATGRPHRDLAAVRRHRRCRSDTPAQPDLSYRIAYGVAGTPTAALRRALTQDERWALVAYLPIAGPSPDVAENTECAPSSCS